MQNKTVHFGNLFHREDNSAGSILKISKFNRLHFEVFFFLIDTLVFHQTALRDPQEAEIKHCFSCRVALRSWGLCALKEDSSLEVRKQKK